VHRVVVRAPVVQLDNVQHVRQRGHYAVGTVRSGSDPAFGLTSLHASLHASLHTAFHASLHASLNASWHGCCVVL
jgi:hypothetical protein